MAATGPDESQIKDADGNVYALGKLLGRGIEGQTFKATVQKIAKGNKSLKVGDEVAIKKQSGTNDRENLAARDREMQVLLREGTLLGSKKPKSKESNQSLYIVQPIFPGVDLRQALYETNNEGVGAKKALSTDEKEKISVALLNDYYAMQQLNIVHCDIKPDNILYDSASGTAKIIDMGQAFIASEGSPHEIFQAPGFLYFSPEALDSKEVKNSAQTDMYGLGILIASIYSDNSYERDAEYGEEENYALEARAALSDVIGSDVKHKTGMPDELLQIVQHMTEIDPKARPANIALARGAAQYSGTQAIHESQTRAEKFIEYDLAETTRTILDNKHLSDEFKTGYKAMLSDLIQENKIKDLPSIQIKLEKLSKQFPAEKPSLKLLNKISDKIDKFTMEEARTIQALRVTQIDTHISQSKAKLYTDSVKGIASMLDNTAKHHKSAGVAVEGNGGMTFLTMGPVNVSQLNEVGKALFVAAKTIEKQKNPEEVDNVLRRLQDTVGKLGAEKFGSNGEKEKGNLLSKIGVAIERLAKVKDYAPQLESERPRVSSSRLS